MRTHVPEKPISRQASSREAPARLALSRPGDRSEQEAERFAAQALGEEAPQTVQAAGRTGSQRPGLVAEAWSPAPAEVSAVLSAPGQPLDRGARAALEPRFGHDFSRVRIHSDSQAAASARAIGALAFTQGEHIAFATGQYRPATEGGRRLLAHELAHTLQPGVDLVRRKLDFSQPKPQLADPIPLVLGGRSILGNTLPSVNGQALPERMSEKTYESVFSALQPQTFNFSATRQGLTGKVDPKLYKIEVSAIVRAITKPRDNLWSGSYPRRVMGNPPAACRPSGKQTVQVELKGKPDSDALYNKVQKHEGEHVADLKKLTNKHLKPSHDYLLGLTGSGKDEQACVADIMNKMKNSEGVARDALAAKEFVDQWLAAVQVYDKPGGSHHSKFRTQVDPNCTQLDINEQ